MARQGTSRSTSTRSIIRKKPHSKKHKRSDVVRCYTECYDMYKNVDFTTQFLLRLRLDNEILKDLVRLIEISDF